LSKKAYDKNKNKAISEITNEMNNID